MEAILGIGARVKSRRLELNITQKELSSKAYTSQSTLQSIEAGVTKNPRNLEALARALNCTPEFLQFGITATDNANVTPAIISKNNLPLISWVQAGNWSEIGALHHDDIEHYLCPVNCSGRAFVLKIQGESMAPRFNEGEHIYVDPEAQPENGSFVVARLEDENQATFKQLIIDGNKKYLKALNPDWPNKFIEINGNCTIIGKVIYFGMKF